MAECHEYLDQDLAAIKCYTRALLGSDQEKMALKKLPKLYKKIGDKEAAAHYFRKSLEQLREEQVRYYFIQNSSECHTTCWREDEEEKIGGSFLTIFYWFFFFLLSVERVGRYIRGVSLSGAL